MPTVRIERIAPRDGIQEEPFETVRGYQLADPKHGTDRHRMENATFVRTLDEAAELIAKGYWIRMARVGKRPSLISPGSLRVVRT